MRRAEQLRKQLSANILFPVTEYVALAIAYVNIKPDGLTDESLHLLVRQMRYRFAVNQPTLSFGQAGWKSQRDPRSSIIFGDAEAQAHREMPSVTEACSHDNHDYLRTIVKAIAQGRRPSVEQHESLEGWVEEHQITYKLSFQNGAAGYLDLPNADLLWYVCIGISALADRSGPFFKSVKRCANFGSDTKSRAGIPCGNYLAAAINTGGRMRDTYCSKECRNRVNTRLAAARRRGKNKKEDQEFREMEANRKLIAVPRSSSALPRTAAKG